MDNQARIPPDDNSPEFPSRVHIRRRRLPHVTYEGATYFTTWRVHPKQADISPEERVLIQNALTHFDGQRYELHAWVVMNDHVHVLVKTHAEWPLEKLIQAWKSYTSHALVATFGRKSPFWQDEYFDRVIRNDNEYLEKAQYILNNPLKRWPDWSDYPWVWAKGLPD